jgi:hypothetical protein
MMVQVRHGGYGGFHGKFCRSMEGMEGMDTFPESLARVLAIFRLLVKASIPSIPSIVDQEPGAQPSMK